MPLPIRKRPRFAPSSLIQMDKFAETHLFRWRQTEKVFKQRGSTFYAARIRTTALDGFKQDLNVYPPF